MAEVIEEKQIPRFNFYAHQQVLKFIKVGPFAQLPCNQQKMRKFSRTVVHPINDLKKYFLKMLFTLIPNAR